MNNNDFILKQAMELKPISESTFNELNTNLRIIESKMNSVFFYRDDVNELIKGKTELIRDNHANHLRFMLNIMKNFDSFIFINTVKWVLETYTKRDISLDYWDVQLNLFLKTYKENLSESAYNEIRPFYTFLIENYRKILKNQ